jgi:hypothetical protein
MSLPGFTAEKSIGAPLFSYGTYGGVNYVGDGNVQMTGWWSRAKKAVGGLGGKAVCVVRCAGSRAVKCIKCGTSPTCWASCVGPSAARCVLRKCV